MAALSLLPLWAFMYVRSLTDAAEVAAGPLGIGADGVQQLRQLPRRRRRGRRRPSVARRRGHSRRSRTSRTSSASCTSAPSTTTSPTSRSTAIPTVAGRRRTPPARSGCDARRGASSAGGALTDAEILVVGLPRALRPAADPTAPSHPGRPSSTTGAPTTRRSSSPCEGGTTLADLDTRRHRRRHRQADPDHRHRHRPGARLGLIVWVDHRARSLTVTVEPRSSISRPAPRRPIPATW